ncbi:ATP-grasp domain-containing protein [Lysinibacillus sp. 54212]|uniref:ATP-grasp domain-containing protein n=1 Tax=Lysinibacillus sp. 54212 TaxID=3119829 RepID=UPI002FC5F36A
MNEDLNILILSCGTRNKIVQYFKKELSDMGNVYVTDCSELAPALYEGDQYFIVPKMTDEGYLETILSICKDYSVKAIFSLIDPEISLLAKNKQAFLDIGTIPVVSDLEIVEMCFNKYQMYKYLVKNNFKTMKSYIDKDEFYRDVEARKINYPVFIKPIKGSASNNINIVRSKEEIELLFNRFDNLMIQELINGVEYGADVYIDMLSNDPVAIFTKEKIGMRAGETDKAISVKDHNMFNLINRFVKITGFNGVIDIDIFKVNGEYYISEVNPRFGGGYPHAYESGVNFPRMMIKNLTGNINMDEIGNYEEGICMMKYNDVKVFSKNTVQNNSIRIQL